MSRKQAHPSNLSSINVFALRCLGAHHLFLGVLGLCQEHREFPHDRRIRAARTQYSHAVLAPSWYAPVYMLSINEFTHYVRSWLQCRMYIRLGTYFYGYWWKVILKFLTHAVSMVCTSSKCPHVCRNAPKPLMWLIFGKQGLYFWQNRVQ